MQPTPDQDRRLREAIDEAFAPLTKALADGKHSLEKCRRELDEARAAIDRAAAAHNETHAALRERVGGGK